MKILIIEDEAGLREVIQDSLEKEKYIVETAHDYISGLDKIGSHDYDCVLVDIMLPGGSGLNLVKEIKSLKKKEAVIIISAKDAVDDKVNGLDLGADDYLSKPFHLAELHARIKSAIRRNSHDGENFVTWNNLTLSPEQRTVLVDKEPLILNRKEFDLLYYFVINPNRLINKTALAEYVWGDHTDQADNLDFVYSQIKNLRKKLKEASADIDIQAVYGIGYKMS
jgi:DNA-binding response OmpR family regulator